jgi:hypothetical protein
MKAVRSSEVSVIMYPAAQRNIPITYWHHPGSHRGPTKGWILLYLTIPLSLSSLWTAHPPAIGPIPGLSSLIPDWSTQSTGLLYNRYPFALGSLIPDYGGSTYLWNVGRQLFYTAVHPTRQFWTSYLPPWELEISHPVTQLSSY